MVLLNKPVIIGIAGGSASGKSSLSRKIYQVFEKTNSITIIKEDDYYKDQRDVDYEERKKVNYDHPLAFDYDLLYQQLNELIEGVTIKKPVYDYANNTRSDMIEIIKPSDVIIIEGLFVLENKHLRELLDIKLYVDTPADIRFIRRLERDIKKRGRTIDLVINQYLNTVRIMHEEFVEPSKKFADLIIPEGGHNQVAIDIINAKIASIINKKML